MNEVGTIDGDIIIVLGNLETEWKCTSNEKITEHDDNPVVKIQNNAFCPKILIATPGCIGVGLDCYDARVDIHDGFKTSLLDFV